MSCTKDTSISPNKQIGWGGPQTNELPKVYNFKSLPLRPLQPVNSINMNTSEKASLSPSGQLGGSGWQDGANPENWSTVGRDGRHGANKRSRNYSGDDAPTPGEAFGNIANHPKGKMEANKPRGKLVTTKNGETFVKDEVFDEALFNTEVFSSFRDVNTQLKREIREQGYKMLDPKLSACVDIPPYQSGSRHETLQNVYQSFALHSIYDYRVGRNRLITPGDAHDLVVQPTASESLFYVFTKYENVLEQLVQQEEIAYYRRGKMGARAQNEPKYEKKRNHEDLWFHKPHIHLHGGWSTHP